jgi:hypothetical protein
MTMGTGFIVFVGHDHFRDHYFRYRSRMEYPFHVHREVVHGFYGRTVLRNEFHKDEHGRFVNEGLGRERIERVTGHKVEVARFEERHPAVRDERPVAARGGTPAAGTHASASAAASEPNKVFRPPATTPKPATASKTASPKSTKK